VTHPPWLVWTDAVGRLDSEAGAVYGEGFAECLAAVPRSAFLAEGSEVQVYRGRRLSSGELGSSAGASS
jgi:protein-L-isoaspartate O-methyltransferase